MGTINLTELAKLPHLNVGQLGDRALNLTAVWDGENWSHWIEAPDGRLIKMRPIDVIHSSYLAKTPARQDDIRISFIEFLWQRASWAQITRPLGGICDDIHLMASSAAKLEYFYAQRKTIEPALIDSFVKTEIEYLVVVARSMFDLFQEIVAYFWNDRVRLADTAAEALRRKHKLPPEFARVAINNGAPRTSTEIASRYGLHTAIAEQYVKYAPFFSSLRASRDGIIHGGSSVDTIFVTEKGFCVSPTSKHYGNYPWRDEHYFNSSIVSLRPWIARVVDQTIEACSEIMRAIASVISFPEEIAPGYQLFIRDPANRALLRLLDVAAGNIVWWEDKDREHS